MPAYFARSALIVVDMQNDFAHPNGSLFVPGGDAVVEAVNAEIVAARRASSLVVYSQDWHPDETPHFEKDGGIWPVHCVAETWGAAFHPELEFGGPIIRKGVDGEDGYSAFSVRDPETGETGETRLAALLRHAGIEHAVVVGLATDYCVVETVIDSVANGFETTVLRGAIAAVNLQPGDGERAIERMAEAGATVE